MTRLGPLGRWQAMRDLTDAPEAAVAAERARVATEGESGSVRSPGRSSRPPIE